MARIKVKEWMESEGIENQEQMNERLGEYVLDSICPAMCDEGCEVEPDGRCEHGCPSLLLAIGMI